MLKDFKLNVSIKWVSLQLSQNFALQLTGPGTREAGWGWFPQHLRLLVLEGQGRPSSDAWEWEIFV